MKHSTKPDAVYSEFLYRLCEMDAKKIEGIQKENRINRYCLNLIYGIINHKNDKLNYVSKLAPDFVSMGFDESRHIDESPMDVLRDSLELALEDESYWYNKRLVEVYLENGSCYAKTSRETGIPRYSIRSTIEEFKEKVRLKYKEIC